MGNHVVRASKPPVKPVDYYLNNVSDLKYKSSLGQTQFLKTVLCWHQEGDVVVKLFLHNDPSILLDSFKKVLQNLIEMTKENLSIATFRIIENRVNFAYLARQFVRYSLYDRVSTRPLLDEIEKYWIVFQILKCLNWCHSKKIYHGDLKLENILITSNLWVVIADFASFKPVFLPENDPSCFNYFFDTSRRRCCNIAPERFVSEQNQSNPSENLTSEMDMFSFGCIIAEIYSDDFLFDLSTLLRYKQEQKLSEQIIEKIHKISNPVIQKIVLNSIKIDPNQRQASNQILSLFPSYFEKLYFFMVDLISLPPDSKILYLVDKIKYYINLFKSSDPKGILILMMVITSSMRSLNHVHVKIQAQHLLRRITHLFSDIVSPFIVDRLIPYLAHSFANDSNECVRAESIDSIVEVLSQVKNLPPSDNNIFLDFLLPLFSSHFHREKSLLVRVRFAINVASLCRIAFIFLQHHSEQQNYYQELEILRENFQNLCLLVLTDSNNCVRRSLFCYPDACNWFCLFFGTSKTNEVILSHIIAFLNEKKDFHLRLVFFDNVIKIAASLGREYSFLLCPLLQQGLYDSEELIIAKTIETLVKFIKIGLFPHSFLIELFKETMPLIYHPNLWIHNATIHFLTTLRSNSTFFSIKLCAISSFADVNFLCKSRWFEMKLLNRNTLDEILLTKNRENLEVFFELLENSDKNDLKTSFKSNNLYEKILFDGLTEEHRFQLLALKETIYKIHTNRRYQNSFFDQKLIRFDIDPNSVISFKDFEVLRSQQSVISQRQQELKSEICWRSFEQSSSCKFSMKLTKNFDGKYRVLNCSPYSSQVEDLITNKRKHLIPYPTTSTVRYVSHKFEPKGQLISHLQEHKASVNQLARFENSMFVSCSDDASIRIWKIESTIPICSSAKQVDSMARPYKGLTCCGRFIIAYSDDNSIHVFQLNEADIERISVFKIKCSCSSIIITSICYLSDNMFAISLNTSSILVFDTRNFSTDSYDSPIIKLKISGQPHLITCIDGDSILLFASTANGLMAFFDLRFQFKIGDCFISKKRIIRIRYTPKGVFSSVFGSPHIALWNHKAMISQRQAQAHRILFTDKSETRFAQNSLLPLMTKNEHSNVFPSVITGGSDMRIRFWNLEQPEKSYIISDPMFDNSFSTSTVSSLNDASLFSSHFSNATYQHTTVCFGKSNFNAIRETYSPSFQNQFLQTQCLTPSTAHQNSITDFLAIDTYLISSDRNGTVKIWS